MSHPLDNPVWNAGIGPHRRFAVGTGNARVFPPAISPLVGVASGSLDHTRDLLDLLAIGQWTAFLMRDTPDLPPQFVVRETDTLLQMHCPRPLRRVDPGTHRIVALGSDDAGAMLALAKATQPGPFGPRTGELGRFVGIRNASGSLVAMSGERMVLDGFVEVSGVCTDPNHRGQGLAKILVSDTSAHIQAGGKEPFLHVRASNTPAISSYEALGYRTRAIIRLTVAERVA